MLFIFSKPSGFFRKAVTLTAATACLATCNRAPSAATQTPAPVVAAPARPAAVPDYTPYQRNAFLFSGEPEAVQSLDSTDILMRRSAVEFLGRWTESDGSSGGNNTRANRAILTQQTSLISLLTRAVRELPNWDCQQAARLLGMFGSEARAALPAVLAALADLPKSPSGSHPGPNDFVAQADLVASITHLSGGLDTLAPTLIGLLHDPDYRIRQLTAEVMPFCADAALQHISPAPREAYPISREKGSRWPGTFARRIIPALAAAVNDPVPEVGAAAANSLPVLAYMPESLP